jgi:dephospho-CoA kinase
VSRRPVIGLTGGIGSGKSAATECFAALGIDIVDADIVSRQVVLRGSEALTKIAGHFGDSILLQDGTLDRRALRDRIFKDPDEKLWLESLLHPLIRREIEHQLRIGNSRYAILVSPLLLETNQHALTDRVLVIDAPEQQQINRTSARDKTTPAAVESIMKAQMSREERLSKADDVIVNDADLSHLQREVERLHRQYSEISRCQAKF